MRRRARHPDRTMALWFVLIGGLAVAASIAARRRIRDYIGRRDTLDDDMIRRIESDGMVEVDDPLDLDEVREEEERFWSETWDLPDED